MVVRVAKKVLADTLAHVERIIPSRSSNPGLSLLRLDVKSGAIELSGSNMDIDIKARMPADVDGDSSHAVMAHVFGMVVRSLPAEDVELDFSDNELQITSGTYTTKLQLVSAASAPVLSFVDVKGEAAKATATSDGATGSIAAEVLVQALAGARYAAAVADFQAVFRGVKLEFGPDSLRAVATDGFRLAYYNVEQGAGITADVIVPARSVDELLRILADGEVALQLGDGQLSVQHGAYSLNLKLMDGAFPDYERVIPSKFPVAITLSSGRLAEAVGRVSLMADKTANNRIDLFIKDGTATITAEGSFGRSQEELQVEQEGTDSEIALAYNARFLVDALGPVSGDVRLQFSGAGASPSVVRDIADDNYLAMVVPLRTG